MYHQFPKLRKSSKCAILFYTLLQYLCNLQIQISSAIQEICINVGDHLKESSKQPKSLVYFTIFHFISFILG
jgi:hypothetical protein